MALNEQVRNLSEEAKEAALLRKHLEEAEQYIVQVSETLREKELTLETVHQSIDNQVKGLQQQVTSLEFERDRLREEMSTK